MRWIFIILVFFSVTAQAGEALPVQHLYAKHCATCHGADRLGSMGTPLLPENLSRLPQSKAAKVIANGEPITQMPAFGSKLSEKDIESLVDYRANCKTPKIC